MKRVLAQVVCLALGLLGGRAAADADGGKAKEALKPLQDFIGGWKGAGGPVKQRPLSSELWNETINWGWRFKGDDAWMVLEFKNGKYYKRGEARYLPETKKIQLLLIGKDDKKTTFEGDVQNEKLVVDAVDKEKKETQRIEINTAAEGIRLIFIYSTKPEGRTLWKRVYQVAANKAGESLGSAGKKNECVVSGGLGTMAVSHKGQTYYVCCSGCRDAFNETPEKFIKEYEAKKAKGEIK
jgi:hypothetical protein